MLIVDILFSVRRKHLQVCSDSVIGRLYIYKNGRMYFVHLFITVLTKSRRVIPLYKRLANSFESACPNCMLVRLSEGILKSKLKSWNLP